MHNHPPNEAGDVYHANVAITLKVIPVFRCETTTESSFFLQRSLHYIMELMRASACTFMCLWRESLADSSDSHLPCGSCSAARDWKAALSEKRGVRWVTPLFGEVKVVWRWLLSQTYGSTRGRKEGHPRKTTLLPYKGHSWADAAQIKPPPHRSIPQ